MPLALLAAGLATQPARANDRQPLAEAMPAEARGLAPTGRLAPTDHLNLAISLPLRQPEALARLLSELYDPASPNYRHFLTPQQFAQRFGPAKEDYQALIDFARANGLTVTGEHPNRTLLDVNGSVADIEKALQTTLRVYPHPTEARAFYAPESEPLIQIAVALLDISGLNNYHRPHPKNLRPFPAVQSGHPTPKTGSSASGAYIGNDFRAAYAPGVTLTGAGQTVGLLEFDGYYASDIAAYESLAGLPAIPLQKVLLDGFNGVPTGGRNSGSDEVSLDIEMTASMAPGLAGIILYEAGTNGIANDILNRMATDDLAKQLSCSWDFGAPTTGSADQIFQQMAAQGQSFFNASGDNGAYAGAIPAPDDDPYITLVGGTTLTTTGAGGAWSAETVWNWYTSRAGSGASGGGISTTYPLPPWQTGVGTSANQGSTTLRNVPDVALTADNVWVIYNNGKSGIFGGTSCAAPLWAGFTALVNQQAAAASGTTVGFVNPALYAIGNGSGYTTAFHDITTGNSFRNARSTRFVAVPGYDLCTGWGTPVGQALIDALAGRQVTVQTGQNLVQNGGFETGDFSDWTLQGSTEDNLVVRSASQTPHPELVHSGSWGALLGQVGGLAYLSQTLPTSPGQLYVLSFWADSPYFSGSDTPNEFLVAWNADTNSTTVLFDQVGMAPFDWTNMQFVVRAAGTSAVLQFGARNDPEAFGLDDVSVVPISPPVFQGVTLVNGALSLTWTVSPWLAYQVQYTTNLAANLWSNIGSAVTATNATLTLSDVQPPDPQRFYRVVPSP
jgi:subtilase family serine protease